MSQQPIKLTIPAPKSGDRILGPAQFEVPSHSVHSLFTWMMNEKIDIGGLSRNDDNTYTLYVSGEDQAKVEWFASEEPGAWLVCKYDPDGEEEWKQFFIESYKTRESAFEDQCEYWEKFLDNKKESTVATHFQFEILTNEEAQQRYPELIEQISHSTDYNFGMIMDSLDDMISDCPWSGSEKYIDTVPKATVIVDTVV